VTTHQWNAPNDLVETDLSEGGITRYDGHHSMITTTVLTDYSACTNAPAGGRAGRARAALPA
jgi:hypothetical protein